MQVHTQRDFLIIGQGLAGSALALALRDRGASVLVVDDDNPSGASRVAAGLITTLAGKGMNPAWRQDEYLPEAVAYFRELERQSGVSMLNLMPIIRPFNDKVQRRKFEAKRRKLEPWLQPNGGLPDHVLAEDGYFTMQHGGRLDTVAYLAVVRERLADDFMTAEFEEGQLQFSDEGVQWGEWQFDRVIYCNGVQAFSSRFWDWVPHRSAKGEMLTIRLEDFPEDVIVSRNGWLVPQGNGSWKAGATYAWDQLDGKPTAEGREDVEARVRGLVKTGFEVLSASAGVRPIVNNSQPIVGMHLEVPRVGIFNGLGSRGVMTSYSVARHFAAFLVDGDPLDPELDFRRLKK